MTDLYTLCYKEVARFLRVWKQTLIPPIITTLLYLMIFWKFLGERVSVIEDIAYIDFIFPWLLMMAVIMASYQNTSSSFFGAKFQHSIEELFVSPISHSKILIGFCVGALLRSFCITILIMLIGMFMIDTSMYSYAYMFIFLFLSALLFALLGIFNGLYAKSFDDIAVIPTFIITPLIYLGWVFYPISILWSFWGTVSLFNPILYIINGFRYAFIGHTDINIYISALMLLLANIIFIVILLRLLRRWYGIRS